MILRPSPSRPLTDIERISKIEEGSCLAIVKYVIGRLNEPEPNCSGIGCVMVAGGPYLKMAYAAISALRETGWQSPVQIWYLGERDIPPGHQRKFEKLDVQFVDAAHVARTNPMRSLGGWTAKGLAVKCCPFQHVLLLDADCFAQRSIEPLFGSEEYLRYGQMFFPDIKPCRPHDRIFPCLGLKVPTSFTENEAGQLMCDKLRNWRAVQFVNFMNSNSDFFYRMFHGDKETWPLAWMTLGMPYTMTPPCSWLRDGILHQWFDQFPITHHRMSCKRESGWPAEIGAKFLEYDSL